MYVPLFVIMINLLWSQITISEVMFDLDGADSPNEFIELYNFSDEYITFQNWLIADKFSTDEITPDGFTVFPPNQFAVILEGDYNGFYDAFFPVDVLLIYVDDLSIGNGLGNNADSLFLINESGIVISEMGWNYPINPGFSLEKIVLDFDDTENNWKRSLDSLGTPGKENSVASFTIDVGIDSIFIDLNSIAPFQEFDLFIKLKNKGILMASSQVFINSELIGNTNIEPNQSQLITFHKSGRPSGSYSYFIEAITENDYTPENDTSTFIINIQFEVGDILINEIMYDPLSGEPEWVEIINQTEKEILLDNWKILDKNDWEITNNTFTFGFPAGNFAIISGEAMDDDLVQYDFPSLNNSGDDVYLFDPTGKMIDHVNFENFWGGSNGFSLERISYFMDSNNSQNWGTCIDPSGSTPFSENSIFVTALHQQGTVSISPNPFSPDGDGFEDETIVLYQLPYSNAYLRMIVYDPTGREIATLADGSVFTNEGTIRWDGQTSQNYTCRMGQYLLYVEATDRQTGKAWKLIERIIVAKK